MATFALSGRSDKLLSLIQRSIDACSKAGFRIITGVKFKLGMCAGEGTEHLSHCCCWGHSEREPGLAGSELPCLARSRQSFVCNKPWSALWALHLSGYQGQAGQWEAALSTAAALTPHIQTSALHTEELELLLSFMCLNYRHPPQLSTKPTQMHPSAQK